jgi:hypothetical protein
MHRAILLGIMCWLAAACGGSGSSPGGGPDANAGSPDSGNGGNPGTGPAKLMLAVTSAQYAKRIDYGAPFFGHAFIDIGLTLKNIGEAQPLPVTLSAFSLETRDKLLYTAIPGRAALPPVCRGNVAVEDGGTLSCHVAFQVPQAATAASVVYSDGMARSGTAAVASVAPAPGECTYWVSPPSSQDCSPCVSNRLQPGGGCDQQNQQRRQSCVAADAACVTGDLCPQVMTGCTVSAGCASALVALQDCLYEGCTNLCPLAAD